jgi:hypothetical protein
MVLPQVSILNQEKSSLKLERKQLTVLGPICHYSSFKSTSVSRSGYKVSEKHLCRTCNILDQWVIPMICVCASGLVRFSA